jgi:Pyruvate ferredoxin/flavodoxin oxidoreductase
VIQVRFHGRGGQGVVTAAELLSVAAFLDGRHAQAFPSFGSERTGAPVMAAEMRPLHLRPACSLCETRDFRVDRDPAAPASHRARYRNARDHLRRTSRAVAGGQVHPRRGFDRHPLHRTRMRVRSPPTAARRDDRVIVTCSVDDASRRSAGLTSIVVCASERLPASASSRLVASGSKRAAVQLTSAR